MGKIEDMIHEIQKNNKAIAKKAEEHITQRYTILIVDDDIISIRTVMNELKDEYRIAVAKSGADALTYLAENIPDLILLDYEMPGVDGPTTLKMIRCDERWAHIPVMFLTGVDNPEEVKSAIELKPQGYILKSSSKEQLLSKIGEILK